MIMSVTLGGMTDKTDQTLEENVIEEQDEKSQNETTTEFSQIPFFVDEHTHEESVDDLNDCTDSFDAIENTSPESDFDESCRTLDASDDDS